VHPRQHATAAILDREAEVTAASLVADAPGDGAAYQRFVAEWHRVATPLIASLLDPFPPVRNGLRLARAARVNGLRDLLRLALLPLRRYVDEEFDGSAAALLFAGSALHADLTPDAAGSALLGWLLVGLGQDHGFPVPVGGAGELTAALVARATRLGVEVRCGAPVDQVLVRHGRAVGVALVDGSRIEARRAVLADCDVRRLLVDMVQPDAIPADIRARLERVQRSSATVKVDWALSAPLPWNEPAAHRAGTVHIAESLDELAMTATQLAMGHVPADPFLLLGQMTTADPTRSPPGTESAWMYTHVPMNVRGDAGGDGITGRWDANERDRFVARVERRIEALAPGFGERILARHVMMPADLEAHDANLVGGDISGGTAQLHQQAVLRPVPGWARPETPVRRLFLASASAHPGGAVHGACGANAARAAIFHHRLRR
jgi:phytoene dehydrogenase-like protein